MLARSQLPVVVREMFSFAGGDIICATMKNSAPFEIQAATNTTAKKISPVVIFKQYEAFLIKSVCFSEAEPLPSSFWSNASHL